MGSLLKCPVCGRDLELAVDECITISKKIRKNGELHKVTNRSYRGDVVGAPYLKCESTKCNFSYDVERASHDERIKELDDWIQEHLEEIYELK